MPGMAGDIASQLALDESSDLPESVMFGENGTTTEDILAEVQEATKSDRDRSLSSAGYHAGPGAASPARLGDIV